MRHDRILWVCWQESCNECALVIGPFHGSALLQVPQRKASTRLTIQLNLFFWQVILAETGSEYSVVIPGYWYVQGLKIVVAWIEDAYRVKTVCILHSFMLRFCLIVVHWGFLSNVVHRFEKEFSFFNFFVRGSYEWLCVSDFWVAVISEPLFFARISLSPILLKRVSGSIKKRGPFIIKLTLSLSESKLRFECD